MKDGYILPLSAWGPEHEPPRIIILSLHGFNDYRMAFKDMAEVMAADGIMTYAYDQRGFGGTEGRGVWPGVEPLFKDARTVLALLRERYPDTPIYLLGKSMGGAVAINAMSTQPVPAIDGTILVAPAVWARQTMPWYQRLALNIGSRFAPERKITGRGVKVRASDNIEMLRGLGADPMVIKETRIDAVHGLGNLMDAALANVPGLTGKTLILYGQKDQIIPHMPTCRMLERLPPVPPAQWRFVLYPEGYHMLTRDLQRSRVHQDISAWVRDMDQDLPSGLETSRWQGLTKLCGKQAPPGT